MTYETRVTQMTVVPTNEPIFSERATAISIEDESGGEFVAITQSHNSGEPKILIEAEDWPLIRQAVNSMLVEIAEREERNSQPKGVILNEGIWEDPRHRPAENEPKERKTK